MTNLNGYECSGQKNRPLVPTFTSDTGTAGLEFYGYAVKLAPYLYVEQRVLLCGRDSNFTATP